MTAPLLDLSIARRFINALTGEEDGVVTWQTFDDKKDRKDQGLAHIWHGRLVDMGKRLVQANEDGAGIYVTVNATDGRGRENENIIGLRALFIDVDGTAPLPTSWRLQPSIIVQRDETHWHAYWLLQPGEKLEAYKAAQTHLACAFLSDPLKDLARVLRVPGFAHNKADPRPVALIHVEQPRVVYSIEEVLTAHPVEWDALPDKLRRHAEREGLCAAKISTPARPIASHANSGDEMRRNEDAFRKWAEKKDTRAGGSNDNGTGNDFAAWTIACEGVGRWQDGLIGEHVIYEVVTAYMGRCGWTNIDQEADTKIRNAKKEPRKHTAVPLQPRPPARSLHGDARMEQRPMAVEDLFASGGAGKPPAPPQPRQGLPSPEPEREPWEHLDLAGLRLRWSLSSNGVFPVELTPDGTRIERQNKRVAGLPIWPERAGTDVATGATWWKLGWLTPYRKPEYQWLSEFDLKQGHALVALPNGPVAKRHAENCAVYLTEARASVTQKRVEVTSRIGWCGVNGGRRWVFPGVGAHQDVEYIGGALPSHGKLEEWAKGLKHLVGLPEDDGFTALTVVCLSAASPWSRLMSARNPILGLMGPSSSGKGSSIDFGLSIWSDIDLMRLPASSTSKGIEDKGIALPDLPLFLDELQQLGELHPQATGNVLYFMANGQRRTTSSKNQQAVGGERRYGVGFYAAEAPVLPGQNLGVLFRCIELDGRPCPTEETAKILQAATQHTGQLAGPIAELLGKRTAAEWVDQLKARAAEMRKAHPGVIGDDPEALTLVDLGAEVLSEVTGITVPRAELITWLAARIKAQRRSVVDRETLCLHQVMSVVLNQNWRGDGPVDRPDEGDRPKASVSLQGRPLAWRTYTAKGLTDTLDIDPLHPQLQPLFVAHGGEERVLRHWAEKGWIAKQDGRNKVKRNGGGRVVRFKNDAWIEVNGPADRTTPTEDAAVS